MRIWFSIKLEFRLDDKLGQPQSSFKFHAHSELYSYPSCAAASAFLRASVANLYLKIPIVLNIIPCIKCIAQKNSILSLSYSLRFAINNNHPRFSLKSFLKMLYKWWCCNIINSFDTLPDHFCKFKIRYFIFFFKIESITFSRN